MFWLPILRSSSRGIIRRLASHQFLWLCFKMFNRKCRCRFSNVCKETLADLALGELLTHRQSAGVLVTRGHGVGYLQQFLGYFLFADCPRHHIFI